MTFSYIYIVLCQAAGRSEDILIFSLRWSSWNEKSSHLQSRDCYMYFETIYHVMIHHTTYKSPLHMLIITWCIWPNLESHWNYGNDYMYTHWKYLSLERIFYRSFLPPTHAEEWWWGKYFWHLCVLLRWGAKYILIPSSSSENALLAQVNLPLRWGIYLL